MIKGVLVGVTQFVAKTGSPYVTLTIKVGREVKETKLVNVWNATMTDFQLWKSITITGEKENDQGVSCSRNNVTLSNLTQELKSLVPQVTTKSQWLSLIKDLCKLISDERREFLINTATSLYEPYSKMPAAKMNHHVYPGGLLDHTYQLLNMFNHVHAALPFKVDPFIVILACMFHDFYKLQEYDAVTFDYKEELVLKGHVFGSAEAVGSYLRGKFPSELILHVQHAILAHHGRPEWGSLTPATSEAFLVHHLDMLSGHGVMYDETPNGVKNYGLGTKVYHYEQS